ncbi:hypothetical protein yc1106_05704 [Curvularia clavata]|uniref:DUF7924 domain-containing protein n=1 Tax=Curvularia clavata TaxID=95742 RepID=A0A9Q9DTX1_CURCL|nr:hypothetical protein yc1106_05704 [Curvularia clavata]
MGVNSRVVKTVARKRQPQKTKITTPIRRSERIRQRLAQEKNAQDTQIRPPIVKKPSYPKRKQPNKPRQRDQPVEKAQRLSSDTAERAHDESAHDDQSMDSFDAIDYWREHREWPQRYLKAKAAKTEVKLHEKVREKRGLPWPIPKAKETPSITDVDESVDYDEYDLKRENIFLKNHAVGLPDEVKQQCDDFFQREEPEPKNTLFDIDIFPVVLQMLRLGNEARIIRDITMLLVPSAEILTIRRPREERIFVETTDELWTDMIPILHPRPRPLYGVGFRKKAFSEDQIKRLEQFVGSVGCRYESYFKTTFLMYFPFLTCYFNEVLNTADRHGAHAAAIAVRAVVELFRLVKREKEVDRQVLAFSISHHDCAVRIWGYYPVIDGDSTQYYRHGIDGFDFEVRDGRRRWDTYKFTRNVYDKWAPKHLKRICSAIDLIPCNSEGNSEDDSEDEDRY